MADGDQVNWKVGFTLNWHQNGAPQVDFHEWLVKLPAGKTKHEVVESTKEAMLAWFHRSNPNNALDEITISYCRKADFDWPPRLMPHTQPSCSLL
jgi:hypothetical protein